MSCCRGSPEGTGHLLGPAVPPRLGAEQDRDEICFYGLAPSAAAAVIPSNRESSLSKSREPSVAPLVM